MELAYLGTDYKLGSDLRGRDNFQSVQYNLYADQSGWCDGETGIIKAVRFW